MENVSEVKKGIISLLMFTLYADEKTIYREYVQNALDSINAAVNEKILARTKDGFVKIDINVKNKTVTIKDNGSGISEKHAAKTLLDISASNKDGIHQAGQFGIGRLVGGGYCHELIFRTSAKGESVGTQVTFDIDKIWEMVKVDKIDYTASYVINSCTEVSRIDADLDDHYFEVILNQVKDDAAPALLNKNEIVEYLNSIAPVEYKPEFNNVLIYNSCEKQPAFKDLHEGLAKIQVFVGDTRIQKKYGLTVQGSKDEINNLEYFKLEDPKYGVLGWGWFALTKYSVQISKDDSLAGIRLRKHNIQIGDANQLSGTRYWKEERGNRYFYGEFFVVHPNIVPNGARDGLVPTPESKRLYEMLTDYFKCLHGLYNTASDARKCIDKIKEGYERMKKNGINDYSAKDSIENKGKAKFEKLKKNASFGPTQRMLSLYEKTYLEALKNVDDYIKQMAPKPTPPEPSYPIEPAEGTKTDDANEPSIDIHEPTTPPSHENETGTGCDDGSKTESTPAAPTQYPEDTSVTEPDPEPSPTSSLLGQADIISSLEGILDKNEMWILRRVFRVLNTYCPAREYDQKLIRQMEQLIVREFSE